MPSLEDRVARAAAAQAAKESEERQKQEALVHAFEETNQASAVMMEEAVDTHEREHLQGQLDALLTKRDALSKIKEVAAKTKVADETKGSSAEILKGKKLKISAIHRKSLETGEPLPKPLEMVKDPEFAEDTEIQEYRSAQEAFTLSVAQAKKVRAELGELGISNYDELLPGQLEQELAAQDAEINAQLRKFVLEHPSVDPEMEAQIREEIISERAKEIKYATRRVDVSSFGEGFHKYLDTHLKEGLGKDGIPFQLTLGPAVQAGMEAFEKSTHGDRARYIQGLDTVFKGSTQISEVDQEAMRRALIEQMVERTQQGYYGPDNDLLADALWREGYRDHNWGLRKEPPSKPSRDPKNAVSETIDRLRSQNNHALTYAVQRLISDYRRYAEYRHGIPSRVKEIDERTETIYDRLNTSTYNRPYSGLPTIERERAALRQEEQNLKTTETELETRIQNLRAAPATLAQYSQWLSSDEEGLSVKNGHLDDELVKIRGEIGQLRTQKRTLEESKVALDRALSAYESAKPGLLGTQSKDQKFAFEVLAERMGVNSRDKSFTKNTASERVTALGREIEQFGDDIATQENVYEKLHRVAEAVSSTARIVGLDRYSGTLGSYIQEVRTAAKEALPATYTEQTALAAQKRELVNKQRDLDSERNNLEREISSLREEKRAAEDRLRQLRDELIRDKILER